MAIGVLDKELDSSVSIKEVKADHLASSLKVHDEIVKTDKTEIVKENKRKNEWIFMRKDIKWLNVILITVVHSITIYALLTFPYLTYWKTLLWTTMIGLMAAFGITGGIHRYWSHKAYKANTPMKIILSVCYLMAGQNSMYHWVRDHRVHHKFSETDADPHNSNRGFFFSHVGWLMLKKHPEVLKKGKMIDMSDLESDPVAVFCEKHFVFLKLMICFVIPTLVPIYCWNDPWYPVVMAQITRYVYVLNATWSVNSFAHFFGNKPYNKTIAPAENKFVSYISFGEGWHNYHHTFPSDYRAAELGGGRFNSTTSIIDLFAKIGWVWDRNFPSESLLKKMIANRGDGTHESLKSSDSEKSKNECAKDFDAHER